jgi:hypothetical protein
LVGQSASPISRAVPNKRVQPTRAHGGGFEQDGAADERRTKRTLNLLDTKPRCGFGINLS